MKILSVSCLIGALMLGLFAAWSAVAPQQTNGNQVVAGWPKCIGDTGAYCQPKAGQSCSASRLVCYDSGGGKDCATLKNFVCTSTGCVIVKDEACL